MKNFIFIAIFLFATDLSCAQTSFKLDTIYANEQKNVAIFFPEPIKQGITGSANFVFSYNREKQQYFGLLQATPGEESNLLVVNIDGSVFSYIVKYKKQLSKLNYFIPISSSIGNERPIVKDSVQAVAPKTDNDNKIYYYQKFCSLLLKSKQGIGSLKKQSEGIVMRVENIFFDKEELYFVIRIENHSTLDYDLNYLNLYTETKKKGKKKSLQRLYRDPVYKHHFPSKIKANQAVQLVYVMPKFSIAKDRRVVLVLNEQDGQRNIKLKISHRFINNPN
ncbi:DUF4138 domain-containing protein [Galbibacter sp.]|uniref:DUF4138 domain-containing protein n=1 Tax=Galbibacter sp. TaxID=2918471 RepID=UPI003A8D7B8F